MRRSRWNKKTSTQMKIKRRERKVMGKRKPILCEYNVAPRSMTTKQKCSAVCIRYPRQYYLIWSRGETSSTWLKVIVAHFFPTLSRMRRKRETRAFERPEASQGYDDRRSWTYFLRLILFRIWVKFCWKNWSLKLLKVSEWFLDQTFCMFKITLC